MITFPTTMRVVPIIAMATYGNWSNRDESQTSESMFVMQGGAANATASTYYQNTTFDAEL